METYGVYLAMKAESMCLTPDRSTCLANGTTAGFINGVVQERERERGVI